MECVALVFELQARRQAQARFDPSLMRLSEVGIAEGDIDRLARVAMLQTRLLMNSPREITLNAAAALYREAL